MASVVVQRSPASTPSGAPPPFSPFVPSPNSSPYSRPHPPISGERSFPGSFPSDTQSEEPRDALDRLADSAPQSGGILPIPDAAKQYLPTTENVQNVLAALSETAKAYLPTSIGNALPIGSTHPNIVEAEVRNPSSYAVPSDLPTAAPSDFSVPRKSATTTDVRTHSLNMDSDIEDCGAQVNNLSGLAGGTAVAGVANGLALADPDASTRSIAPSSVKATRTGTTNSTTISSFSPSNKSESRSSRSSTPAPEDSQFHSESGASASDRTNADPTFLKDSIKSSGRAGNDGTSRTVSNPSNLSVSTGDSSSNLSGVSGTVSGGYEDESTGDKEDDGKGEKRKKAKRLVKKVKSKLHIGH